MKLLSLISEFNRLREEILQRGGNLGFRRDSELVVTEVLKLLG